MAQWLRAQIVLEEDQVWFPAPTSGGLQLPITPVTGDLTPSSERQIRTYVYVCMSICKDILLT